MNSVLSNKLSLKYQRCTPYCNNIGITEFAAKPQFLHNKTNTVYTLQKSEIFKNRELNIITFEKDKLHIFQVKIFLLIQRLSHEI